MEENTRRLEVESMVQFEARMENEHKEERKPKASSSTTTCNGRECQVSSSRLGALYLILQRYPSNPIPIITALCYIHPWKIVFLGSSSHLVAILSLWMRLASTSSSSCSPSSSSTWSTTSSTTSSLLRSPPASLTHPQKRRHWCRLFASWRVMQTRTASWDCNGDTFQTFCDGTDMIHWQVRNKLSTKLQIHDSSFSASDCHRRDRISCGKYAGIEWQKV